MVFGAKWGFSLGALAGVGAAYTFVQSRRAEAIQPGVVTQGPFADAHPAVKHGMPIKERIRVFSGFVAAYDPSTKNPIWVLEHIDKNSASGGAQRKNLFYEDAVIPERFRAKLSAFVGSPFDRGHLAPAMNHKSSQSEMDETFCLANISPQVGGGFNRDYWARFEKFVKDVVKKSDDVYVVTGPVFAPQVTPQGVRSGHAYIGAPPDAIAVPTHFFKVVLAEWRDSQTQGPRHAAAAFAMPNGPIDPGTPITSFVVPLDFLERVTGIQFFPHLLLDGHRNALDSAATGAPTLAGHLFMCFVITGRTTCA